MSDPGEDVTDATSDGDLSAENQALLIQIDNLMAEGLGRPRDRRYISRD